MKRLIAAVTLILCAVLTFPPAHAENFALAESFAFADGPVYARAASERAYFFLGKDDGSAIFTVPYTYCIEIIRDEEEWYYCSYASDAGIYKKVYGYCKKDDFTPVGGAPDVTYLYKTVSVTYTTGENNPSLPVLSDITVEAAFYGNFYSGAGEYSYVYAQGSFGYIKGATEDFPLAGPDSADNPQPDGSAEKGGINVALVTALAICALAALALLLLYYTSKKSRRDG